MTYLETLSKYFHFSSFRNHQLEIITSIIETSSDICCILATGHGKSLCYQFPPIHTQKPAIIVSPLISLMQDQQSKLTQLGIPSCTYNSTVPNKQILNKEILAGKYLLIYITPETILTNQEFLKTLYSKHSLSLIAIDEAHCISTWGNTFRGDYQHLGILKSLFPSVPILALTGTATSIVETDICTQLNLKNPKIIRTSANRSNLSYYVFKKSPDIWTDLSSYINSDEHAIIYCQTRKDTEKIADILQNHSFKAMAYHGGMLDSNRKKTQDLFMNKEINIIVATISFGMGIDAPFISLIIHYGAPKDMESYLQETGRAGRDGRPSKCITFFSNKDFQISKSHLKGISDSDVRNSQNIGIAKIENYLNTPTCRRKYILSYFNETLLESQTPCCDNCDSSVKSISKDVTNDVMFFLKLLNDYPYKFGKTMYIDVLWGRNIKKMPIFFKHHSSYNSAVSNSKEELKAILSDLLQHEYVSEKILAGKYGATIGITEKGKQFISSSNSYELIVNDSVLSKKSKSNPSPEKIKDTIPTNPIPHSSPEKNKNITETLENNKHTIPTKNKPNSSPEKKKLISETVEKSYNFFMIDKLDLKEIANYRHLTVKTIEDHLAVSIGAGKEMDFKRLGLNKEIYGKVIDAVNKVTDKELKPIRDICGRKISYFMIKCSLAVKKADRGCELE